MRGRSGGAQAGEASLRSNEGRYALPGHRQGVPDAIPPGNAAKNPSAERAPDNCELGALWILAAETGMELWPRHTAAGKCTAQREEARRRGWQGIPAFGSENQRAESALLRRPARAARAERRAGGAVRGRSGGNSSPPNRIITKADKCGGVLDSGGS